MSTSIPAAQLVPRVQKLLEDRVQHVDAVNSIDQLLAGVGVALGGANPAEPAAAHLSTNAVTGDLGERKRRGRQSKFAMSAEESILRFVRECQHPTTKDIVKHWSTEGRGGKADNTLSLMVKKKKLKRTPLGKGIMGSRYSVM